MATALHFLSLTTQKFSNLIVNNSVKQNMVEILWTFYDQVFCADVNANGEIQVFLISLLYKGNTDDKGVGSEKL